jgi:hypothetical protein
MNKFFLIVSCAVFLLFFASCERKAKKTETYYYSDHGIDSHKSTADTLVDLGSTKDIEDFLRGKTFISKGSRIEFNDSLDVTMIVNGKMVSIYKCNVAEYILKEERLILLNDSAANTAMKLTLAPQGTLTDMETYSLYSLKEK